MNEYIILICHLVRRRWNFKYTQKSTQALKYLSDAGCITESHCFFEIRINELKFR